MPDFAMNDELDISIEGNIYINYWLHSIPHYMLDIGAPWLWVTYHFAITYKSATSLEPLVFPCQKVVAFDNIKAIQ